MFELKKLFPKQLRNKDTYYDELDTQIYEAEAIGGMRIQSCYDEVIVNQIYPQLMNRTYNNVSVISVNYGFVLCSNEGYKTSYNFDFSQLNLLKLNYKLNVEDEPVGEFLVLKGVLNYTISIGYFKPYRYAATGETDPYTKFSCSGSMPINSVLACGHLERYSECEFAMKLCKNRQYLSCNNGAIKIDFCNPRNFICMMNNPDYIKQINVPFQVEFVPKYNSCMEY